MNRRKNTKGIIVALVILLLVCISVGYARISTTLRINGKTGISDASWNVHFDNLTVTKGSKYAKSVTNGSGETTYPGQAHIANTEKTLIEYEVTLPTPGDIYEFETDIVNDGSIDAELSDVRISLVDVSDEIKAQLNGKYYIKDVDDHDVEQKGNPLLLCEITYVTKEDGTHYDEFKKRDETTNPVTQGDVITGKANASTTADKKRIRVMVKYNEDIIAAQLPTTGLNATLQVELDYVQANIGANN